MKKITLLLLVLNYNITKAQITFEKGYFTTNEGTRNECLIKNIDWRDNPTEFEYKMNETDSQSKKETISNIQEFGIYGESKYKRFKVNMERSSTDLNNISKSKYPVWKQEVHFLKVLIEGDGSLYSFSEDNLFKYFYETKNISLEQLIRIKYSTQDNNAGIDSYSNSIRENNQFRQQLFNNVRCNTTTENDFKNLKYEKSALIKIFEKYNSCNANSTTNYDSKSNKKNLALKLTGGIDIASLTISDPNIYYNLGTAIKGKAIFKIGFETEYILPFNKNTWSVFLNPAYQKFEEDKTYVKNDGFGVTGKDITNTANISYSSLEIPIGVRNYIFLNTSSKLFINIGYSFNFISKSNFNFNFNDDAKVLKSSSRNNVIIGLGYNYKNKYSIETRINTAREILSDYVSWSGKYSSFGILLGYKIF